MARAINELSQLQLDEQIKILSSLSKNTMMVEIDGKLYPIPPQVFELIESLNTELTELKDSPIGISSNKES